MMVSARHHYTPVFSLNGLKRIECSKVFPVWQVWPWPSGRGHSPRQPTDCETLQNQIANCKNTNLGLQTRTLVLVLEISAHTASNFQNCGKPTLIVTHAAKTGLRLGHWSSYQLTSLQSLQNAKVFTAKAESDRLVKNMTKPSADTVNS